MNWAAFYSPGLNSHSEQLNSEDQRFKYHVYPPGAAKAQSDFMSLLCSVLHRLHLHLVVHLRACSFMLPWSQTALINKSCWFALNIFIVLLSSVEAQTTSVYTSKSGGPEKWQPYLTFSVIEVLPTNVSMNVGCQSENCVILLYLFRFVWKTTERVDTVIL